MGRNAIRLTLGAVVLGIALASVAIGPKTYGKGEQQIEVESFAWGVNASQFMRVCFGNAVDAPGPIGPVTDNFSVNFVAIKLESGVTTHETELQVPFGQFRCTDLSYQSLVAAGVLPQSNSALQFFVNIRSRSSSIRVGSAQEITVGAVQSIDVATGEIKLNHPFRVGQTR